MHGASCVSSVISVWNNQQNSPCSLNSGCSSMSKAMDYRSQGGATCGFEPTGRRFPDPFQQLFLSQFYAGPSELHR